MIKICINDPEEKIEKVIPMPYIVIEKILSHALNGEDNKDTINDVLKQLKSFSKKNPGFAIVDIHDHEGTTIKITI